MLEGMEKGDWAMIEIRLRTRISEADMADKVGKILGPNDLSAVITHDARVLKPNGDLLFVYRRGAIPAHLNDASYPILTTIRAETTNRGLASGSVRLKRKTNPQNSYSRPVMSSIIGAFEGGGARFPYCRLTAWTGIHTEQFRAIYPFFQHVAALFKETVPERFYVQMGKTLETKVDWVIEGTPFTTITINNTYATGVHKDQGDLPEGFSCLATLRRGEYAGGILSFPEFRVGVDMQDGDCIFMDAHEWHGNTELVKLSDDAERISCVFYYRTDMVKCDSAERELENAKLKTGALE